MAVDIRDGYSVVWAGHHGEVALILVHVDEHGDVYQRAFVWARSRNAQRIVVFDSSADVLRLADDLHEMAS